MRITEEEIEQGTLLEQMTETRGWKEIMKPWLLKHIDENKDIMKLNNTDDDAKLLFKARSQMTKADVYNGVLLFVDNTINKAKAGQGANNGTAGR